MATNTGMLMASSLAGFLVLAFGVTPLFVFNSLTFVASAERCSSTMLLRK